MEITPRIKYVEGSFDTKSCKMLCVAQPNHGTVNLCIKSSGGWNIPIAQIKLHSEPRYVDFEATLEDAKALGNEIARRWNECNDKK